MDPTHVLELDTVQVHKDLTYETQFTRIEDQRIKQLRGKIINLLKVLWSDTIGDPTWELEDKMREQFSNLFPW